MGRAGRPVRVLKQIAPATIVGALIAWSALAPTLVSAAEARDDEHPFEALRKRNAVHQIVKDIDQASFDLAIAHYPRIDREGEHKIAVGRYMMWKIVDLFQSTDRVGRLTLSQFDQRCWAQRGFADRRTVWCTISATLNVSKGPQRQLLAYTARSQNVGQFFDSTRSFYWPVIRASVRRQIDAAVASFAQQMRARGILVPK